MSDIVSDVEMHTARADTAAYVLCVFESRLGVVVCSADGSTLTLQAAAAEIAAQPATTTARGT